MFALWRRLRERFIRSKQKPAIVTPVGDRNHLTGQGLHGDSPIRQPSDDAFGIDPFARAIAHSIRETDARDGLVFAVNGPWGSGKSSAINLILHHLAPEIEAGQIAATTFNPWWFTGAESLTISFFEELRAIVGDSVSDQAREAMTTLGSRIGAAAPLLGGIMAMFATPAAGAAASGGAMLLEKLTRFGSTVESQHRKIVKELEGQKKKFLIVLDDIDRLSTDEALQIFKLVKSIGRLPNVVYLLAFDRHLAEKMVAERFPAEGVSFLEKVVQGGFDLPMPDRGDLGRQLLSVVEAVMGAPPPEKMVRFWNLFHDNVEPLLNTPRDAIRLGNAIKVSWPAIQSEVDRADLLSIEAMRLFLPSTYEAVRAHPNLLVGSQPRHQQDQRTIEAEYNSIFLANVISSRNREIAKRALRRLFPRLDAVWSNTWQMESDRWKRDRLICSKVHFQTYFYLHVTNDGITSTESDALVAAAGTPGLTAKLLTAFLAMERRNGGTRAALALDELSVRASDIDVTHLEALVADLFNVADDLDVPADRGSAFSDIVSNQLRLHWLLNNLLLDRIAMPQRSAIIRAAASGAALCWLISFSDRCDDILKKRGTTEDRGENFVDDDTTAWLMSQSLDRLRAAAVDGTLVKNSDLVGLLFRWRDRAGDDEVRAWTDRQLCSDKFIVALAIHLIQESWSAGLGGFGSLGDHVAKRTEYVKLGPLKPILDVDKFRARVGEMLVESELNLEDRAALERFQATPDRDPGSL